MDEWAKTPKETFQNLVECDVITVLVAKIVSCLNTLVHKTDIWIELVLHFILNVCMNYVYIYINKLYKVSSSTQHFPEHILAVSISHLILPSF